MDFQQFRRVQGRRDFLQECSGGFGLVALWHLLAVESQASATGTPMGGQNPMAPKAPHFAPKAKNVIYLFMGGGPSQLDLFDPKPTLSKWNGQSLPESMTKDLRLAFIKPTAKVWASNRTFSRYGQCGMEFSDLLPHTAGCADDICMIRSVYTEQFNHLPGMLMLNCGSPLAGHPSIGAWVTYGLGSESENLPGYVMMNSAEDPVGSGNTCCSSGFLPSSYQAVTFRNSGDPVLYLSSPPGISEQTQRARLNAVRDLNQQHFASTGDLEIASRIASYELAFRMQTATPELVDLSKESAATLKMYGVNNKPDPGLGYKGTNFNRFAINCLLARRMVERGVRFVHLFHNDWDHHYDLNRKLKQNCDMIDQPAAALLKDLKQRGLLDSTLVVWAGEFGRTPMVETTRVSEGDNRGRDHHPLAFSVWMAGGGIKGGQVVGKTDDFCFNILEDKIHVHDLHATILHCLGLNHEKLTYRHSGRDFRLTDVKGQVVAKLLA